MSSLYSPALDREMRQHSTEALDRAANRLVRAAIAQLRSINADQAAAIEGDPERLADLRNEYRTLLANAD